MKVYVRYGYPCWSDTIDISFEWILLHGKDVK